MCIGAGDPDLDAKRNREIEKLIREDGKKMAKEVKLLLLGEPSFITFSGSLRIQF
jgi:guanine nucleotide-binding protein subunit alpha